MADHFWEMRFEIYFGGVSLTLIGLAACWFLARRKLSRENAAYSRKQDVTWSILLIGAGVLLMPLGLISYSEPDSVAPGLWSALIVPGWNVLLFAVGFTCLLHGLTWTKIIHWKILQKAIDYLWYGGALFSLTLAASSILDDQKRSLRIEEVRNEAFIREVISEALEDCADPRSSPIVRESTFCQAFRVQDPNVCEAFASTHLVEFKYGVGYMGLSNPSSCYISINDFGLDIESYLKRPSAPKIHTWSSGRICCPIAARSLLGTSSRNGQDVYSSLTSFQIFIKQTKQYIEYYAYSIASTLIAFLNTIKPHWLLILGGLIAIRLIKTTAEVREAIERQRVSE